MNLTSLIVAKPEGGTAPLAPWENLPLTGYFVGGVVVPLVLDEDEIHTREGRERVDEFIEYLGNSTQAAFLGWWTDEETGKLWVDGTSHHSTEFVAGRIGRRRREIAIYDIARQRELRLVYVEGEV